MKNNRDRFCVVLAWMIIFLSSYGWASEAMLVEDDFSGASASLPDAAKFTWDGQLAQNGAGQLVFSTTTVNLSWLRSIVGAAPRDGQTLVLDIRGATYAENPNVYGDKQPRGLRVGGDSDNAIEFYSISAVSLGMRVRRDGVESLATYDLPSRVDTMHDYQIAVTPGSVTFKVDAVEAGVITTNIPPGVLNVYVSTHDGYAGNVPVTLDQLALSLITSVVQETPAIASFSPTSGVTGSSVIITGTDFTNASAVAFAGVDAPFTVVSDTQIDAIVPDSAVTGTISVTNASGSGTSTGNFTVTPTPPYTVLVADEASLDAALSGNTGLIVFDCDGTIDISTTKVISSDLIIDASGHDITINGDNSVRAFTVNPGVRLSLKCFTVRNGQSVDFGGGIYNNGGVVTASECTFSGNSVVASSGTGGAAKGGAIYNDGALASLTLNRCTFMDNVVTGAMGVNGVNGGGGTWDGGMGGTGGHGNGGAICNNGGIITITNGTFNNNRALGGSGGTGGRGADGYRQWHNLPWPQDGYYTTVPGGKGGRGGIGGDGEGGSIYNSSGQISLLNVTVARGLASGGYGGSPGSPGAYQYTTWGSGPSGFANSGNTRVVSGALTLKNTIVAYGTPSNSLGSIVDDGHNIGSDGSIIFSLGSSRSNTDPLLAGAPAENGGVTMTIELSSQSPAINHGDDTAAPASDQRNRVRIGWSDIGAYEFQPAVISSDASLTDIAVSSTALSPTFLPSITSYAGYVPNGTAFVVVTPVSADAFALITVNGGGVVSGMPSAPIPLSIGNNSIIVAVTAPDGSKTDYSISIDNTPYGSWKRGVFTTAQLADLAVCGDFSDPSHDGIANLVKYALLINPFMCGAEFMPKQSQEDGYLLLTYRKNKFASDVNFTVQAGDDLAGDGWITLTTIVSLVDGGDHWLVKVRDVVPITERSCRFIRLKVSMN